MIHPHTGIGYIHFLNLCVHVFLSGVPLASCDTCLADISLIQAGSNDCDLVTFTPSDSLLCKSAHSGGSRTAVADNSFLTPRMGMFLA